MHLTRIKRLSSLYALPYWQVTLLENLFKQSLSHALPRQARVRHLCTNALEYDDSNRVLHVLVVPTDLSHLDVMHIEHNVYASMLGYVLEEKDTL
jgi:hypothetical protein